MGLSRVLARDKTLRVIGFDDAPFDRGADEPVAVAGVVCKNTRFEGMVWGHVTRDGFDATQVVSELLLGGKFLPQLHLVLLDGVAFGGFNIVDLPELHRRLGVPCATVMRARPDMAAIESAIAELPRPEQRLALLRRAGPIHPCRHAFFQAHGAPAAAVGEAIDRVTDTGHIPEPIRLAHLIGAAVRTGESGRRA